MKDTARKNKTALSYGPIVTSITHILIHVFTRIHPALFPLLRTEFNLSLQQLGVLASIPRLFSSLLSVPAGLLSDRFGSKRMILISLIVSCFGILIVTQTYNYVTLIVAIILVSINITIYHPASYRFITQLQARERLKALSIHEACGTLGVAVGPITVSVLMGVLGLNWRQVYVFWLIPVLVGIIAVVKIRSDPRRDIREDKPDGSNTSVSSLLTINLILFLIFLGVRMVAGQMVEIFIPIYLVDEKGVSSVLASFIYGIGSAARVVGAPAGGLLASRFGTKRWLLAALSLTYVSLGLAVVVPNTVAFISFYIAYSFCTTLSMTANSAIMAQLSPTHRRGLGYALFFLPGSLVGAAAPLISVSIADAFGMTSIFAVSVTIYIIGQVILKFGIKV
ncbi:MAG: MFS transporter [Candidatus Bathyarchaeota archaeon]|nr:MFS transporter [Candidatus Bathyarchaeota archaeon]